MGGVEDDATPLHLCFRSQICVCGKKTFQHLLSGSLSLSSEGAQRFSVVLILSLILYSFFSLNSRKGSSILLLESSSLFLRIGVLPLPRGSFFCFSVELSDTLRRLSMLLFSFSFCFFSILRFWRAVCWCSSVQELRNNGGSCLRQLELQGASDS